MNENKIIIDFFVCVPCQIVDFTIEELHVFFQRADRLSRTLDPQQYMEFTECRQTNFSESLNFASLRLLFVNSV